MQRAQVDVPLSAGLSQKQDLRDIAASGAAVMTNCVMEKNGAVRKRAGMVAVSASISSGGSIAAVVNGGPYKRAPWLVDGEFFYSWSPFTGQWLKQDVISDAVALDRIGIGSFTQTIADMDQASGNGFLVFVYTSDPTGLGYEALFYTVLDESNNAPVVATSRVDTAFTASAIAPKLIVCGQTVVLTYVNGTSLVARTLNLATPAAAWSAETTLATDGFFTISTGVYDAAATTGDATRFCVAYEVNPATHTGACVAIKTFTVAGLALAHAEFDETLLTAHLVSIAVVSTANEYHWAVYTGQDAGPANRVKTWAWLDTAPATHVAPFNVYAFGSDAPGRIAAARTDATDITAYWSPAINTASNNGTLLSTAYVKSAMLSTGGTHTALTVTGGCVLTSKPVATNGTAYLAVQTPSTEQGTAFLCRDDGWAQAPLFGGGRSPLRAVATLDPRLMKDTATISMQGTFYQTLPHIVPNLTAGPAVWMMLAFENTSPTHQAIYDFPIDLASSARYSSAELYELDGLAAGVPSVYDGQGVCEQNFLAYPEIASAAYSTTGGSMQTSGVYQYLATYEIYDSRGQLTQSGTSDPFKVSASGSGNTGSCVVTVPGLSLTQRQSVADAAVPIAKAFAYVILYRTQADGTTFYRVTADPPPAAQQVNASLAIAITDAASDASIATDAVVYTTGGNLDHLNPPSARICIQHMNRWVYAGCPDPTALWPSAELTTGIAPAWNENINVTCSGAIRALASMDGNLVIFVQRGATYGIEVMTGQGPTDAGTQSDWTPPQVVPSDSGALDQRGVCVGPFGCLYRSPVGGPNSSGGIFLLARDMQVSYVSRAVEDTLAAYPTVTSMLVHPSNGRVYVTCVNPATPTLGMRLVWDYVQGGVWSTDLIGQTVGASASWVANFGAASASVVHAQGGTLLVEDPTGTSYLDAGAYVLMAYTSAWIKSTKSGFARFWRALVSLDSLEPTNVNMALTFDYAPSTYYNETRGWAYTALPSFDRYPQVDVDITPNNQKAKAMQVSLSDSVPAAFTSGQGFSIGAITFDIGLKDGPFQNIPSAQRA